MLFNPTRGIIEWISCDYHFDLDVLLPECLQCFEGYIVSFVFHWPAENPEVRFSFDTESEVKRGLGGVDDGDSVPII